MHPPTMAAAVVPRPPWWHHGGRCRQFTSRCVDGRCGVVVGCALLDKLASKHAFFDHGGRLPSHRLGSLHTKSVASLRPPIRSIMAAAAAEAA
jgi:hypothetical protein